MRAIVISCIGVVREKMHVSNAQDTFSIKWAYYHQ